MLARCRRLLLLVSGIALIVTGSARAQEEPTAPTPMPGRFGVIESFEDPAAADRLGATWTRARFQWADIQAEGPDAFVPPLTDEELAAELDAGRQVIGLIIGIPDWARDRRGLPRGLGLPADDPENTWATFVRDLTARYRGRIDHWIIWNEPDIADADAPGHTWDGTIEDFAQLQRTAYKVIKETNPEAVVHLSAFTYFWDPTYFGRLLDLLLEDPTAAEHNAYFDVATAHLYFQPNAIYNVLYAFDAVMAARGLEKPLWLVETNAPPMDDPYWTVPNWTLEVTLNEQAAFIPQALAAALAAGAERIAVYKLMDTAGDRAANPEPFGLLRWDNSRRPAFDTYRVAIRLLDEVDSAERERWDGVGQIRLDQPGKTTTVLFARLPRPQEARVKAHAESAELVDMWGKRETIVPEDGYFTVELPAALCNQTIADYCMIGGTTYYLVQEGEARIAATMTPTPSLTPANTPAPTATATITTSPTNAPTRTTTPSPTDTSPASSVSVSDAGGSEELSAEAEPAAQNASTARPTSGHDRYPGLIVLGLAVAAAVGLTLWWRLVSRR